MTISIKTFAKCLLAFYNINNNRVTNMNALKIIEYIRKHNITKSEFCKKCNISLSTLDDIIYYGKSVDYMVAEKISDAMGIGVYALYSYEYNTNCSII